MPSKGMVKRHTCVVFLPLFAVKFHVDGTPVQQIKGFLLCCAVSLIKEKGLRFFFRLEQPSIVLIKKVHVILVAFFEVQHGFHCLVIIRGFVLLGEFRFAFADILFKLALYPYK